MKKKLSHICGIEIPKFPIQLEKVGELIYFEGALMSLCADGSGNPFIQDWVDSNDSVNRWLIYATNAELLQEYIFGRLTHFQLLFNANQDTIFVVDRDNSNNETKCIITSSAKLPYEYLPQTDLKFQSEDAIGLDEIKATFKLKDEKYSIKHSQFDILEEAKKNQSELINIHITSRDNKVRYGRIFSSVLGEVLSGFGKLSQATALRLFDHKGNLEDGENRPRRKRGELIELKNLAEYEYVYAKAASFSVFLKPAYQRNDLFEDSSSSELIAKSMFQLFNSRDDLESIRESKKNLNESVLNSYSAFLRDIKSKEITVSLQYGNPLNHVVLRETFNEKSAHQIITALNTLEYENEHDIKVHGHFKALDSVNHSFKFQTNQDHLYTGTFSDQLKEGIFKFNLTNYYSATITVRESKKSGKKHISEKDIMVSCIDFEE